MFGEKVVGQQRLPGSTLLNKSGGNSIDFYRPCRQYPVEPMKSEIDAAVGRVCFAALARDSLGRVSNGAGAEVCATTVRPPFFYGCAIARGARDSRLAWIALACAFAILRLRRR